MKNGKVASIGDWVRPVGHRNNGEIDQRESRLGNKEGDQQPELLDIVEIQFLKKNSLNGHPEDWLIHPSQPWCFRGKLKQDHLELLADTPASVWEIGFERQDRVSAEVFQTQGLSSLCLVQVENFKIEIIEKANPRAGRIEKKRRAKFEYNRRQYDLALTDPAMQNKYFPAFPNFPVGNVKGPSSNPYICISMTPELNGFHYKLVAAVFE